jgi:hypothetical protein
MEMEMETDEVEGIILLFVVLYLTVARSFI